MSIISNKARGRGQRILVRLSNLSSHSIVAATYIHVLSCLSRVWLFATPWTVVCQASQFMGFSRQECWSGLPCPPPGSLPSPGIKPTTLMSPALAGSSLPLAPPGKPLHFEHTGKTICHLFLLGIYDNFHLWNDIWHHLI